MSAAPPSPRLPDPRARRRRGLASLLAPPLALGLAASLLAPPAGARPLAPRYPERRFMVGLDGVAFLTPALHPRLVRLDARYVGETTTLGGGGIFGRWRIADRIGLEATVRSGSLRLRNPSTGDVVAQDVLLADLGVLLYLARGEIGQLAIDAGVGGIGHQLRYDLADGRQGSQRFGGLSTRVGVDIELLLRRVALVFALRAHGVVSDPRRASVRGDAFAGAPPDQREPPLPAHQTWIVGSLGLAYRF